MARNKPRASYQAFSSPLLSSALTVLAYVVFMTLSNAFSNHSPKTPTPTPTPRSFPTPSPTPKPDPVDDALARAIQGFKAGKIAFVYPEAMKLDETKTVEARISETQSKELTEGLSQNGGHIQIEDISVAPLMVTTLKGSAFDITPLTKEEQLIAPDRFTAWDWSIHPTDWGKQSLYLGVCVRLELPKGEERRCAPVYQREIAVQVNPMYAATHFVKNNMAWTLGVLGSGFSAFCGGIVVLIKRKKKPKGAGFAA